MPALTWEQIQRIVIESISEYFGEHLKDIEINILQDAWLGLTYREMAEKYHLSINYLRGDLGPRIWQKLSSALGEEVTKKNFKETLERFVQKQQQSSSQDSSLVPAPLANYAFPEGCLALNSPFYMERYGIDRLCHQLLLKSGALIQIKAPRFMGKTSLMIRLLQEIEAQNYQTVYLNLKGTERRIIGNLNHFLPWLCFTISRHLKLDSSFLNNWKTDILGNNDNCTIYFEEYLLPALESPLVLGLDNLDRLFPQAEMLEDFWGMIASWHERAKRSELWQKLRIIVAYSTESKAFLELETDLLNVGAIVILTDFDRPTVERLLHLYNLQWQKSQQEALMRMIGGHPYLVSLSLYEIATGNLTLEQLLQEAPTEAGIYRDYLRRYLRTLRQSSDLAQAYKRVVTSTIPLQLDVFQIEQLSSMGLVRKQGNYVLPKCQLYRDYFRSVSIFQ